MGPSARSTRVMVGIVPHFQPACYLVPSSRTMPASVSSMPWAMTSASMLSATLRISLASMSPVRNGSCARRIPMFKTP